MQNGLQEGSTCFRYADDTTVLRNSTPQKHLDGCVQMMDDSLHSIETLATNNPRSDGEGINSPWLFTHGETKALAKSRVRQ